jgi:hypothetical protein
MLRSLKELYNFVLEAEDGDVGRCSDFLFDDGGWTVRYMVADTGTWLPGRKVLISPISLGTPSWKTKRFPIMLTREQIKSSPDLDEHAPVSREYEKRWMDHYGWSYYWFGSGLWGPAESPTGLFTVSGKEKVAEEEKLEDGSLRSTREVTGYRIQAADGEIGHVEDFVMDDANWAIRYMVVDTVNWLPGRKVLITPEWIENVDWVDNRVQVDLTRQEVKNSPEYDPALPVNREYEVRLYDFYGRPRYW